MFDRFTERARKVMTLSRIEAGKYGHDYIGTEHILLGVVEEGSGVGAQVLKKLVGDPRRIRAEIDRYIEHGTTPATNKQLPFTPRAKRVLELAFEEAVSLGHDYIGTEHVLCGLVLESDGPSAHVLGALGVGPENVRAGILELLGDGPGGAQPATVKMTVAMDWESVPPSPAVDWALVARMRERADAILAKAIPWGFTRCAFELLPAKGGWSYRLSIGLQVGQGTGNVLLVTVDGGLLRDMEKNLPGVLDSLVKSIEGKDEGSEPAKPEPDRGEPDGA